LAYSKTSIVSLAVMLLGHKPIQSLDNADDLVTAAEQAYDILLPSVLATGNWRFSMQIQQLTLTSIIPPLQTGWQNVYQLPSGFLKNIRIIPQNYDYEIYANNLIYCNWGTQSEVFMEYAFLPDTSQLPPWFVNYFIWEIACFLALASAQKPDYFKVLVQQKNVAWAIAAAADAQNRPQFSQTVFPVLNNRFISGIMGPSNVG
jgi:hypothetical protein